MTELRRLGSASVWEEQVGYCRAVRHGELIEVSGTTAVDERGEIVGEGDVAAQTRQIFARIERALRQLGGDLTTVLRTRIYTTDIERWREVAAVHRELFAGHPPAATMVEVARLIDPRLLVEIEVTATVAVPRASAS